VETWLIDRQKSHSVSTTLIGPERVPELRSVWASLHEHYTALEARGKTRILGTLRDLESSWQGQRRFYERALQRNAFLVLAEAGPTAVGYALVACRRHPLWAERSFGSLEVLCVRPMSSGPASLGSMLLRGYVLHAVLLALIQEGQRRGLSQWSAVTLEANNSVRRAIERLGGERALVTYRGQVAAVANRLRDHDYASTLGRHRSAQKARRRLARSAQPR
jgi:hypothetical protein